MRIEPMGYGDIDGAAAVYVESWQAGYHGLVSQEYLDALTAERWAPVFRASFDKPGAPQGLVLRTADAIAGVSHFSAARDDDVPAGYGEIISLYLRPAYWGRGWGSALLQAALEALRAQGFTHVLLWTLWDNTRAQRAYLRAGFQPDGVEKEEEIGGVPLPMMRFTKPL